jgi:RimJ/RimL family protein N-acetyltransferase
VIRTERLTLRKPRLEDAEPLGATPARVEAWINEWRANGLGYFTVLHRNVIVGRVGFHVFDSRTWTLTTFEESGEHAVVELGWTLVPEHRGRGYATEAARAARQWAARENLISLIEPANIASARVAERLGATPGRRVEQPESVSVVWEHPR